MTLIQIRTYMVRPLFYAILCGTLLAAGCGPGMVKTKQMIPEQMNVVTQHTGTVKLMVAGGRSEHAMKLPEISNEAFLEALEAAVTKSRLFQTAGKEEDADFQIDANIFNLSEPFWGRAPVSLEIAWQLFRLPDQTLLWKDDIVTTDDGYGDSGGQSYNKTKAIESAARKNISLAIERMSAVNIVPASK